MENQNPTPTSKTRPTNFGNVLRPAFDLFKNNLKMIALIMLIPALVQVFLELGLSESFVDKFMDWPTSLYLTFTIGIIVISMVADYLGFGAAIKLVSDKSKSHSLSDTINYAISRLQEAIMLAIKIIVYTYAWILLVGVLILSAPVILDVLNMDPDYAQLFQGGVAMFVIVAMIVVFIIFYKRLLSVAFAYPLLLSNEKMDSKEALEKSIEMSKGMLGTVFVNYLLFGLLMGIIGGVYGYIIGGIVINIVSNVQTFDLVFNATLIPLIVFTSGLGAMFQYSFMLKAEEEKKTN